MENLSEAIKVLKSGGVIAFPTDTVFGLGACLDQPAAIERIYKIKNRPKDKPLQILVADFYQAQTLGVFNQAAEEFAAKNWPGPFTLVVKKKRQVPDLVTGGKDTVGLRVPAHEIPLELIKHCGPLAATSANLADEQPVVSLADLNDLLAGVDYLVPGKVKTGRASKVIDFTGPAQVLRD